MNRDEDPLPGAGPPLPPADPIERLDGAAAGALRERLATSGFGPLLVAEAEAIAPAQLDAVRLPLVHWWLERRSGPGAALARLFIYQAALARAEAEDALGKALVETLAGAGVLRAQGQTIASAFRITPLDGLYVLSDPPDGGSAAAMGPGMTTLDLVRLVPAKAGAVLDLGCGAGTLALLAAARGASRAVGADLNERAVALARFNARLNGLAAEFRAGDLLEPVRGERFDLVLCQPPYVVHPPGIAPTTYLHGGPRGDELALRFAAALPAALSERGRALLLFDTAPSSEPLQSRLRAVLGTAPADLVVLLAPGPSADLQAVAYASLEDGTLGACYRDSARHYRDHLETLGGSAFSRALVVLARSPVPGGRFTVQQPVGGLSRLDAAALDAFLAALELAGSDEAVLLRSAVRLAPGARLVEERAAGKVLEAPLRSVRFEKGMLASDREISEAGLFLFEALEEGPGIEDAVARFAEACGDAPEVVRRTVADFVREGLSRGLLVPR